MRMRVLVMLNIECSVATLYGSEATRALRVASSAIIKSVVAGLGKPKADTTPPMSLRKGRNRIVAQITPKRLNTICALAVLFADMFATDAAILEVMVVPMFSPSTIAAAIENGMKPLATSTIVMAIVAAEDWSIKVITAPVTIKMMMEPKPKPVSRDRKILTGSLSSRTVEVSLRVARPRNRRAKPIRNSPPLFRFFFFIERRTKAKNISGTAMVPKLKPPPPNDRAKIQAVTVVPILAPIMTPIAFASDSNPAFTKLTIIRVVAVEDCTSAVMTKPVITLLNAVEVIEAIKERSLSPAIFCRPPLIRDIP